jgi:gamma-glutamyltranspeptidase / glutathione hydrolase
MSKRVLRRKFLKSASFFAASATAIPRQLRGAKVSAIGLVNGQPVAERIGMQVLQDGGNSIDAIVAAALASAIAAPSSTGIGGYGLSAVVAIKESGGVFAVDGNTVAPQATPKELFQPDASGQLPIGLSSRDTTASVGWLTAGVPGILAGLQLMLDRFGTLKMGQLMRPAIALAREGIVWPKNLAAFVNKNQFMQRDPGSKRLYLPGGTAVREGDLFKNPELADMLSQLAKADSVDAFYRGDIAQRIADGFQKNGGLVTANDLSNYHARIVAPTRITIGQSTLHTAPLTAGGVSVLEMLLMLEELKWQSISEPVKKLHAKVEVMRMAWRDRLVELGDPEHVGVSVDRLLSKEYIAEASQKVMQAVQQQTLLQHRVPTRNPTGTIHLNSVDHAGNMASLTLTHGNGFGACVTVEGLGLTLGHGLSRFDPNPNHPNGPAPGKRPLHNMVPTVLTQAGVPVLAIGGTGGRKIPNALFDVLCALLFDKMPIASAMAASRLNTEGTATIALEKTWPESDRDALSRIGYSIKSEAGANMHAIAMDQGVLARVSR